MRISRFALPAPRGRAVGLLGLGVALVLSGPAAGDAVTDDGAPVQMVSFFQSGSAACPSGWTTASVAAGRLVVAVTKTEEVGVQVGAPLGDQEDRQHQHGFAARADLPFKSVSAADGGNDEGAAAGVREWTGQTAPAASGLPFIQLPVCERQ